LFGRNEAAHSSSRANSRSERAAREIATHYIEDRSTRESFPAPRSTSILLFLTFEEEEMEPMLDRIIARRVCDGLYEDRAVRVEASGMRIASQGGTVILEGIMSCRAAKERARAIAAAIQDVIASTTG
jgi:hypothetical protein